MLTVRLPTVRMLARARTKKRRKVGKLKASLRASNKERAGVGKAW